MFVDLLGSNLFFFEGGQEKLYIFKEFKINMF